MTDQQDSLNQSTIERILSLDPTLRDDERKALAVLLISGGWAKFAEVASEAGITRGAIYDVIRRLEERDLVVTDQGPGEAKQVRTNDPRLLLPSLTAHAQVAQRKADDLASAFGAIQDRLTGIYDKPGGRGPIGPAEHVHFTRSANSSMGRLLRLVKEASREVWVLGSEAPWIAPNSPLLSELMSRAMAPGHLKVRFLVARPGADARRVSVLDGFRGSAVEVRISDTRIGPYVVVDTRTLFLYQSIEGQLTSGYYIDVVAPALCTDIVMLAGREWEKLNPTREGSSQRRRRRP